MRYVFAYKSSDGVRHEDSMNATSREEVFNELRRKGIKAIKVVAADGSKANGEVRGVRKRVAVFASIGAAIMAGLLVYVWKPQPPRAAELPREGLKFTSERSRVAYTNLEVRAQEVLSAHDRAIGNLELDVLANYQLIENSRDTALFLGKIRAGYKAVDASRAATRDLFRPIFEIFSADCAAERTAAQGLYAGVMDRLDVAEGRIANDEKAFRLLDANRGKWHFRKGKVEWKDAALANEFEYFRREVAPSTARWRKDFNVIESNVVEIPASK